MIYYALLREKFLHLSKEVSNSPKRCEAEKSTKLNFFKIQNTGFEAKTVKLAQILMH